jgi:HAD superfamily hydrolase (TIGR01490 family)
MKTLTLFDLDGTLLDIDTDHAFNEFMVTFGWADAESFRAGNDLHYAAYLAERLDIDAYVAFATAPWRGRSPAEQAAASARYVDKVIRPALRPQAIDLVKRHQDAGDVVAIVTATNHFVTRPIADLFGVQDLIATELARDAEGRVTGAIHGVPSFRAGKVSRVDAWLASTGRAWTDFDRTLFYSDSTNDLPLLERASEPVATNPSPALERLALDRGWRILKLFE